MEKCRICGARLGDDALAHMLVAHGPLVSDGKKRRKTRKMLSRLHRRLEREGFDELEVHVIVRLVAEELRGLGLV